MLSEDRCLDDTILIGIISAYRPTVKNISSLLIFIIKTSTTGQIQLENYCCLLIEMKIKNKVDNLLGPIGYCIKLLPEKNSGYFNRSFFLRVSPFFPYGKVNANLSFYTLPGFFSDKSFMQWAPGVIIPVKLKAVGAASMWPPESRYGLVTDASSNLVSCFSALPCCY